MVSRGTRFSGTGPAVWHGAVVRYLTVMAWTAIVIGTVLRFTQLPTRAVYLDEAYTQMRVAGHTADEMSRAFFTGKSTTAGAIAVDLAVGADASPQRTIASLEREDAQHPPLFYVIELGLVKVFGNDLLVWRLGAAVFGVASIAAAFVLARSLFADSSVALLAAAVFAVSPIERIYSDQAREYSLLTFVLLTATIILLRAVQRGRPVDWFAYGALALAGLYANPLMLYVMAGHCVFVVGATWRTRHSATPLTGFAVAAAIALAAYAPWFYELFVHRNDIALTNAWSSTHWPVTRLAAKWLFNAGSTFFDLEYSDLKWTLIFAIVGIAAAVAIWRGFRVAGAEARWCLGAAILVPVLFLALPDIVLGQHRSAVARYALPAFAMLAIVAAGGLAGRPVSATIVLGGGLLACAIGALHPSWWDNDSNADDRRISAIVSGVPRAQVVSTLPPALFMPFARFLAPGVRVSLSADITRAQFERGDPVFVLRPTVPQVTALEAHTGLHFHPVAFTRTLTAHDIGASIAHDGSSGAAADLYRAGGD